MLKQFTVHDYKGLHKYLVLSKQRFGAGTPGVMSWARDRHRSSGRRTSHSNTLSGCKAWAQIALWQVKDKHGSYLILGSGMTRPESRTQVVNFRGCGQKNEASKW